MNQTEFSERRRCLFRLGATVVAGGPVNDVDQTAAALGVGRELAVGRMTAATAWDALCSIFMAPAPYPRRVGDLGNVAVGAGLGESAAWLGRHPPGAGRRAGTGLQGPNTSMVIGQEEGTVQ